MLVPCVWLELTWDFSICLCLFTGQVILTLTQNPQDVLIVVTEGNNVTFQCSIPGQTITVTIRLPGESTFGTIVPASNVMGDSINDEATITVVNSQRSENSMAFQCASTGASTDIGVLNVYCKLYDWKWEREREKLEYVLSFDFWLYLEPWNHCLPQWAVYPNECFQRFKQDTQPCCYWAEHRVCRDSI